MSETMLRIWVDGIDRMGAVAIGLGTDERGRRVVFVGEGRMLRTIDQLLTEGARHVPADVPAWAVLTTSRDREEIDA